MLVYQRVKSTKTQINPHKSVVDVRGWTAVEAENGTVVTMAELELVFSELFSATSAGQCTNIYTYIYIYIIYIYILYILYNVALYFADRYRILLKYLFAFNVYL